MQYRYGPPPNPPRFPGPADPGKHTRKDLRWLIREVRPFLVGATILLVGYVAFVLSGMADMAWTDDSSMTIWLIVLLLPWVAYLAAGLLAPPHPWVTGGLLAVIHAAIVFVGINRGADAYARSDGFAQMGKAAASLIIVGLSLLFSGLGVILTGIIGSDRREHQKPARPPRPWSR
jgi:hypothetical protein